MPQAADEKSEPIAERPRWRAWQQIARPGERWVILYDGECGFCNANVRRLHRRDTLGQFWFAPLTGSYAEGVLCSRPSLRGMDTLVLAIERDGLVSEVFTHSTAVLQIMRRLGGVYSVVALLRFVPSFARDWMYRIVAARRRGLLGRDTCSVPSASLRARMLG